MDYILDINLALTVVIVNNKIESEAFLLSKS